MVDCYPSQGANSGNSGRCLELIHSFSEKPESAAGSIMRILLCSYVFAPSIGGIETISRILADQFCRLGSTVTVVTHTPGEEKRGAYEVVRRPSLKNLRELADRSDIIFQSNISLHTLLPLFFARKPIVVAHHIWLTRANGRRRWQDYLKYAVLPLCHNIAISKAVAAFLPVKSIVIYDPFETDEFKDLGEANRTKDIVFMGRLVSDKGCDLALRALAILRQGGLNPSFTVIGDGPEMPALKCLVAELGLSQRVVFRGTMREGRGSEVAQHKIMVIPSAWAEPFGVVALEGLAAGCVLVASSAGGLPEAVGPCGILFPCGDVKALASALQKLLQNASLRKRLMSESRGHLRRFQPEIVARQYMNFFESVLRP